MNTNIELSNKSIERLGESGYQPAEFPLLCLVPLVRLAWAEDYVQKSERKAILQIAADLGITRRHANHSDLLEWLDERPTDAFFDQTDEILREMLEILLPEQSENLRRILQTGCEEIAGAAPDVGFFSYRSPVTPEEMAEINRFNESLGLRAEAFI